MVDPSFRTGAQMPTTGHSTTTTATAEGEAAEYICLQRDVHSLLGYLEQLADSRLFAQFEDTRRQAKPDAGPARLATPPCARYSDFLNRLDRIARSGVAKSDGGAAAAAADDTAKPAAVVDADGPAKPADGTPQLTDTAFLRWSRNFLASLAAPATLQSIRTTDEFLKVRGRYRRFWTRIQNWLHPGDASHEPQSDRLRLPRSVLRLEAGLIAVTILTVVVSAYAMVGKYISDQRSDALTNFLNIVHQVEADSILIAPVSGSAVVMPAASRGSDRIRDNVLDICNHDIFDQASFAQAKTTTDGEGNSAVQAASLKRIQDCRELQWALLRLLGESIRMRTWETVFVGRQDGSLLERARSFVLAPLVGWSHDVISQYSYGVETHFCQEAAGGPQGTATDCQQLVLDLIKDVGSTSSSILGWITLILVPSLYALIGAGAATMLELRRKVDNWTLVLSDRNRIAYNMILGSAFGAIIGMFSRALGSETTIGPAAFALLAGFNVPGVFSFLDQFSKQVFRLGDTSPAAREQEAPR